MFLQYLIPLFVFFLFLLVGTLYFIQRIYTKTKGVHTKAVIVAYEARESKDRYGNIDVFHHPVIKFNLLTGEEITVVHGDADTLLRSYMIGREVDITYLPDRPKVLVLHSSSKTVPLIILIIGIIGFSIFLYLSIMSIDI